MIDLDKAFRFVSPQVHEAATKTAQQLEHLGIRYALAGGLAVAAHGYLRATNDVYFLVGDEAFEHHGIVVTFKAGVPIEVNGIRIDYLSPEALGGHVEWAFKGEDALRVVPIEVLIYMKLVANRRKDQLDVVELVKSGINIKDIRAYLASNASDLVDLFNDLAREALEDS